MYACVHLYSARWYWLEVCTFGCISRYRVWIAARSARASRCISRTKASLHRHVVCVAALYTRVYECVYTYIYARKRLCYDAKHIADSHE